MTVFITGATAGFGLATAKRFLQDGAKVIGTGRRANRLEKVAGELGASFLPLAFDVGNRKQAEQAIAKLPADFAAVDVLVNNAGGAIGLDPAQKADLDDWDAMIDSNIKGLVYCTRLMLPGMIERGRGHIVNLGSVAGEFPYPGGNVFGSALQRRYEKSRRRLRGRRSADSGRHCRRDSLDRDAAGASQHK